MRKRAGSRHLRRLRWVFLSNVQVPRASTTTGHHHHSSPLTTPCQHLLIYSPIHRCGRPTYTSYFFGHEGAPDVSLNRSCAKDNIYGFDTATMTAMYKRFCMPYMMNVTDTGIVKNISSAEMVKSLSAGCPSVASPNSIPRV